MKQREQGGEDGAAQAEGEEEGVAQAGVGEGGAQAGGGGVGEGGGPCSSPDTVRMFEENTVCVPDVHKDLNAAWNLWNVSAAVFAGLTRMMDKPPYSIV